MTMLEPALLSILEEAGIAVLTLTEGVEKEEFLASRLTRTETQRQALIMGNTAANLPPQLKALLAEVDWAGWRSVTRQIASGDAGHRDALWFAVRSLVPATLMWLRVYRQHQPEVFAYTTAPSAGDADT